jgi:tetratricopeptide (TPR) repeat protein
MTWLPLAGLATIAVTLWYFRRNPWAQAVLFGGGCFVLALLPVLGFFDIYFFRYSFVADHFQYLASAALIALMVAGSARLLGRTRASRIVGVFVLALLSGVTWRQSQTFADSEKLYRATIACNPDCWMAHNNLGGLYLEQGRTEEAIERFQVVLQYQSDDAGVYNNLGSALFRLGRVNEAVAQFKHAVDLKPDYPEAHFNLANAAYELGQLGEAVAHYETTLRLRPNYAEAHFNLGNTLARQGRGVEAAEQYQQAVRFAPGDADMRAALAGVFAQEGRLTEAAEQYQRAVQLRPEFPGAHYNLANILLQLGDGVEAVAHYRTALELIPDSLPAHFNLATALLRMNQPTEAIAHYQEALALDPNLATAYYGLAVAFSRLGDFDRATNACDRAIQMNATLSQALADGAWLLATHSGSAPADLERAVDWATRACQLTGNIDPAYLDALAAAHAATSNFSNAMAIAGQAVALAGQSTNSPLQQQALSRLKLYRAGQPYQTNLPAPLPSDW